jgi:hypothetical protein
MMTEASDERLGAIAQLMDSVGLDAQFTELDPFGERHGCWERTLHRESGGLRRYVSLAITADEYNPEVSVIAGAEDDQRRRRIDLGTIQLEGGDPARWPTESIRRLLRSAVQIAQEIEAVQLDDDRRLAS